MYRIILSYVHGNSIFARFLLFLLKTPPFAELCVRSCLDPPTRIPFRIDLYVGRASGAACDEIGRDSENYLLNLGEG